MKYIVLLISLLVYSNAEAQYCDDTFDCKYTIAGNDFVMSDSTDYLLCNLVQQEAQTINNLLKDQSEWLGCNEKIIMSDYKIGKLEREKVTLQQEIVRLEKLINKLKKKKHLP